MEESGFSGVIRLSNVSDFIAPNLDCIIPLKTVEKKKEPEQPQVAIRAKKKKEPENRENSEKPKKPDSSIKISLADCLACNGCITSAETVLVEEQSFGRLLEGVRSSRLSVLTVSPQSIISIAVKLQKSPESVARWIARFFKAQGVHHVIDSSFARHFAHSLLSEELELELGSARTPLLSSACPGFVCYAEKSHGELLIPRISKIRSPQAISGGLVKSFLAQKQGISASEVFHAAVMPCFDKKLEASREQFGKEGVRETDCVVSTAELLEEMQKASDDTDSEGSEGVVNSEYNWLTALDDGVIIGERGGASGGYADRVVKDFLEKNGGVVKTEKLNKNMTSITVSNTSEDVVLRVAKVYGFRNIQNLVRKMKTKKEKTDYVEVMACPGGCGNGGGQIRYETMNEREEKLKKVEETYENLKMSELSSSVERIRSEWKAMDPNWRDSLFTDYKMVETNVAQALKW